MKNVPDGLVGDQSGIRTALGIGVPGGSVIGQGEKSVWTRVGAVRS